MRRRTAVFAQGKYLCQACVFAFQLQVVYASTVKLSVVASLLPCTDPMGDSSDEEIVGAETSFQDATNSVLGSYSSQHTYYT